MPVTFYQSGVLTRWGTEIFYPRILISRYFLFRDTGKGESRLLWRNYDDHWLISKASIMWQSAHDATPSVL